MNEENINITNTNAPAFIDFKAVSAAAGAIDSPMKRGEKLLTKNVVGQNLTIERVGMSRALEKKSGETRFYPIFWFKECPDSYYPGGMLLAQNVQAWAAASGDDPLDFNLPRLNAAITTQGGIPIILNSVKGGQGTEYVTVSIR